MVAPHDQVKRLLPRMISSMLFCLKPQILSARRCVVRSHDFRPPRASMAAMALRTGNAPKQQPRVSGGLGRARPQLWIWLEQGQQEGSRTPAEQLPTRRFLEHRLSVRCGGVLPHAAEQARPRVGAATVGLAAEGGRAREQLEREDARRPDVNLGTIFGPARKHLGSHIRRIANHLVHASSRIVAFRKPPRKAKVDQLASRATAAAAEAATPRSRVGQDDVARVHVAVDDAAAVAVRERLEDLTREVGGLNLGQRTALREQLAAVATRQILQDERRLAAGVSGASSRQVLPELHDAWVREQTQHVALGLHQLPSRRRQPLRAQHLSDPAAVGTGASDHAETGGQVGTLLSVDLDVSACILDLAGTHALGHAAATATNPAVHGPGRQRDAPSRCRCGSRCCDLGGSAARPGLEELTELLGAHEAITIDIKSIEGLSQVWSQQGVRARVHQGRHEP
mmetsp:Transcript_72140/g.203633  ORF Transcript_72140/g.203633 Transcript_72140/m.203633 type:complete len:454 (-) Transcript_72140:165-1526(-)